MLIPCDCFVQVENRTRHAGPCGKFDRISILRLYRFSDCNEGIGRFLVADILLFVLVIELSQYAQFCRPGLSRKGGAPGVFRVLQETSGIEDLWQLHWSYNAGLENTPARFIANVDEPATIAEVLTTPTTGVPAAPRAGGPGAPAHTPAYLIRVSVQQDGSFTVTNTRNSFSKTYRPRS